MGLMGTLVKVAIGYAAARGVDKLAAGQAMGGGAQIKGESPTSEMQAQMAQMMGGQMPEGGNPMQAMMDKMKDSGMDLSSLMGGMAGGAGGNPMAAMMEQMSKAGFDMSALMGGAKPEAGDQGGLLSSASGGGAGMAGMMAAMGAAASAQGQSIGGMLDAFNTREAAPDAEAVAALMLRAMIQAAKADGGIDAAEKAKILETVGEDADAEDIAFVQEQLAAPVDVAGLAADTPEMQKMQVYSASLMTIRVDTAAEAQYLDALAKAMGLDEATVNALHMQMGMQPLYN